MLYYYLFHSLQGLKMNTYESKDLVTGCVLRNAARAVWTFCDMKADAVSGRYADRHSWQALPILRSNPCCLLPGPFFSLINNSLWGLSSNFTSPSMISHSSELPKHLAVIWLNQNSLFLIKDEEEEGKGGRGMRVKKGGRRKGRKDEEK